MFESKPTSSKCPVDLFSLIPSNTIPPSELENDKISFAKFFIKISIESVNPKKFNSNL